MKRKAAFLTALLLTAATFVSCGSDGASYDSASYYDAAPEAAESYDYDGDWAYEESAMEDSDKSASTNGLSVGAAEEYDPSKKMVYYGDASIDTLDFDTSLEAFKTLLKDNKGFVESENLSDGMDTYSYYYVESDEKHRTYYATVRIPAGNYDSMMDQLDGLGDVRSKNSRTENMSQEYKDLSITLDVLQQTYDRYGAILETATDEEYILEIVQKMSELQIQIEQTKSRMNRIDSDVTYSYLDITIREVRKYTETPPHTDTFVDRLKNTLVETGTGFLAFLEALLFFIIRAFPYAVIIAVIVVIVIVVSKKHPRRKKQQMPGYPQSPQGQSMTPPAQNPQESNVDSKEGK